MSDEPNNYGLGDAPDWFGDYVKAYAILACIIFPPLWILYIWIDSKYDW